MIKEKERLEINEDTLTQAKVNLDLKIKKKTSIIIIGIAFLIIIGLFLTTLITVKDITLEIKDLNLEIIKGKDSEITLKEDAFDVIDDTEINLDDGLNNVEIEEALDNMKFSYKTIIDGNLEDQKKNAQKLNKLWGIEQGFEFAYDINLVFDKDFKQRLSYTHLQHIYIIKNLNYVNQRSVPSIGNIICVPTSAVILLNGLGYNIDLTNLIDFFKTDDIKQFARTRFNSTINKYIEENKLYQITGVFTYGLNLYMGINYPDFPYILDYDYWTIEEIAEYVEKYALMSATYLPSYVLRGERKNGHMIVISKTYYDYEGNLLGFGINDPFGNPNIKYRGYDGLDGKNVIIDLETMKVCMKSYRDDNHRGTKDKYRILYFKDK